MFLMYDYQVLVEDFVWLEKGVSFWVVFEKIVMMGQTFEVGGCSKVIL